MLAECFQQPCAPPPAHSSLVLCLFVVGICRCHRLLQPAMQQTSSYSVFDLPVLTAYCRVCPVTSCQVTWQIPPSWSYGASCTAAAAVALAALSCQWTWTPRRMMCCPPGLQQWMHCCGPACWVPRRGPLLRCRLLSCCCSSRHAGWRMATGALRVAAPAMRMHCCCWPTA